MGCDIHLHTEIKIEGVWYHYTHPSINRNYGLFSFMANVRNLHPENENYIVPLCMPKGLPDNLSLVTKLDYERYGCDAHDMSWFNAKEINLLETWANRHHMSWWGADEWGFLFGNFWHEFVEVCTTKDYEGLFPTEIEDIRFVFWFDN